MKLVFIATIFLPASIAWGQASTTMSSQPSQYSFHSGNKLRMEWSDAASKPGNQDDPGYDLYKRGYELIIQEKWKNAQEVLSELVKRYPRSEYRDDAMYWMAYALKFREKNEAMAAYNNFLHQYRDSKYYDDAVADLNELRSTVVIRAPGAEELTPPTEVDVLFVPQPEMMERQLRSLERRMRLRAPLADYGRARKFESAHWTSTLDSDTQLKIDVLYTLRRSPKDENGFKTIRRIALDHSQNTHVRIAALEALVEFDKFDPFTVFVNVAKTDTNAEVQNDAIVYIARTTKDKNKSVSILVDLYNSLPENKTDQRHNIFYTIAEIGNNKAVDFLTKVARSDEARDLRSDAVYYLGTIGNDRAREALYELLKSK
ncbi:MAG TPA: HEAT repeat domain-containing protein [Bacteroidota bacterium]